jgi:hypothetical protein
MKLLLATLLATIALAAGQFGGGFRQQSGGSCDFRRLQQAVVQKDQCMQEFFNLKKEAMQAIGRSDPSCNRGLLQSFQQCDQPIRNFQEQNDLSASGMFECCFGSRIGGFSQRTCEWKNKPIPDKGGHKGGKGHKGHKGRGGMGGMGGEQIEEMMMRAKTMAGWILTDMEGYLGMVKHMAWCMDEERPVNMNTLTSTYRQYADRLIAKLWECETPLLQIATNCTDVQFEDLECIVKGVMWSGIWIKGCMESCHPDSLDGFCQMFTGRGISTSNNNNFNSNTNNNFFDPFGTK